jgi:hypothetical protein
LESTAAIRGGNRRRILRLWLSRRRARRSAAAIATRNGHHESAVGDATKLVDEQEVVGDPASHTGKRPERPYFPGWTAWQYPVHVILDLGAPTRVTRAFFYNESGENPLTLGTGTPLSWNEEAVTLGGYRNWREVPVATTTRFLRITLTRPTSLPEIVLYGDPAAPPPLPAPVRIAARYRPTMDQFIGANAFIDDPIETVSAAVGFVREYHDWQWDTEGPDHALRFQPSGAAGG